MRDDIERRGGRDAAALEALVTAPGLGAPPASSGGDGGDGSAGSDGDRSRSAPSRGRAAKPRGDLPASASSTPSVVDVAASAAAGGDDTKAPWLLLGVIAITVAIGGLALARRRAGSE